MAASAEGRLLRQLPAIYRRDSEGLSALLQAFEEMLFDGDGEHTLDRLPGIERELRELPALFAPLGVEDGGAASTHRTPERFVPWLAAWLAFAPYRWVAPHRLRHVIAGIVPLYARRGTRAYVEQLLRLCFDDEVDAVRIDEHDRAGLRVGIAKLGTDSLLARERPFWFRVEVQLRGGSTPPDASTGARLVQRLRAVIDFAKPAHTAYELELHDPRSG